MRIRALVGGLVVGLVLLVGSGSAHAEYAPSCPDGGLGTADCPYFDNTMNDGAPGISGGFGALMVIMLLVGVGMTLYKLSVAKDMARRAGMDEGDAVRTTLLSEDGLAATYVAASLRDGQRRTGYTPTPEPRTVERRLAELKRLHDKGLISPEEYEARRSAVLDEV